MISPELQPRISRMKTTKQLFLAGVLAMLALCNHAHADFKSQQEAFEKKVSDRLDQWRRSMAAYKTDLVKAITERHELKSKKQPPADYDKQLAAIEQKIKNSSSDIEREAGYMRADIKLMQLGDVPVKDRSKILDEVAAHLVRFAITKGDEFKKEDIRLSD